MSSQIVEEMNHKVSQRKMLITVTITGILAVVIGAFGAHGLKPKLELSLLNTYETGVSYHFYHLFAMSFAYLLHIHKESDWIKRGFWFFFIGIILFSGSLYLLSIRDLIGLTIYKWLGPLTPIGGLCFILGWISILVSIYEDRRGN